MLCLNSYKKKLYITSEYIFCCFFIYVDMVDCNDMTKLVCWHGWIYWHDKAGVCWHDWVHWHDKAGVCWHNWVYWHDKAGVCVDIADHQCVGVCWHDMAVTCWHGWHVLTWLVCVLACHVIAGMCWHGWCVCWHVMAGMCWCGRSVLTCGGVFSDTPWQWPGSIWWHRGRGEVLT